MMESTSRLGRRVAAGLALALVLAVVTTGAVAAEGATVTAGQLRAFATSSDPGIGGHAVMIRTADGRTIVSLQVVGLASETPYGAHLHAAPCSVGFADGHYRDDPAGAATPPNELWPAFTTNAAGIGSGWAVADWTAGPSAVSVVVHAPGGAKIACADLA